MDITTAAEGYLSKKQTTLWADWDITRPESRDKAVAWLTEQVQGVIDEAFAQRQSEHAYHPGDIPIPTGREVGALPPISEVAST